MQRSETVGISPKNNPVPAEAAYKVSSVLQNPLKHFRWSLRTQILLVMFAGYGMLLWQWRNSWEYAGEMRPHDFAALQTKRSVSPDGRHEIYEREIEAPISSYLSALLGEKIISLEYFQEGFHRVGFIDNDTILADVELGPDRQRHDILFHRRFPEWWWGHLYRPEIWFFPFLLGAVIWSIRKDRAMKR